MNIRSCIGIGIAIGIGTGFDGDPGHDGTVCRPGAGLTHDLASEDGQPSAYYRASIEARIELGRRG